jgi:hypothetical protein
MAEGIVYSADTEDELLVFGKKLLRCDGLFVIPALLNDQPFSLLFDSGAAFSKINPSAAALLELPVSRSNPTRPYQSCDLGENKINPPSI